MTDIMNIINPELIGVVTVLYILGLMLKSTEKVKDKYIPLTLGVVGIALSFVWIVGTEGLSVLGAFTALTQGILSAGAAVYTNQLIKQMGKNE